MIPITDDKILKEIWQFLHNEKELVKIERAIFGLPEDYESELENLKVSLVSKFNDIYLVFINNYSRQRLFKILSYKFPNLKFYVLTARKIVGENVMFFIKQMSVYNQYDEDFFNFISSLYDWMVQNKVEFVHVEDRNIPVME